MGKNCPPNLAHHLELQSWLDMATNGLCDAAKQRVENEIRSHFREAVDARAIEGLAEDEARRVAMAALGDARQARRTFRKVYLTTRQAKLVRAWNHRIDSRLFALCTVCIILGQIFLTLFPFVVGIDRTFSGILDRLALYAALDIQLFIFCGLTPRLARQRQWRRLFVWRSVASMMLWVWGIQMHGILLPFVPLPIVVELLLDVSTFRKLGKNIDLYAPLLNGGDDGGRYA